MVFGDFKVSHVLKPLRQNLYDGNVTEELTEYLFRSGHLSLQQRNKILSKRTNFKATEKMIKICSNKGETTLPAIENFLKSDPNHGNLLTEFHKHWKQENVRRASISSMENSMMYQAMAIL